MTNGGERIARILEIADNDSKEQEPISLLTIHTYDENDQPGSPRIVGYAFTKNLACAMIEVAEEYAEMDIDVLVGSIDARAASDDDWNELIAYLVDKERGEELADLVEARMHMDAPQATRDQKGACPTCRGKGVVPHPVIANYYGDCPDCGSGDVVM
jgi:hypothetical protein